MSSSDELRRLLRETRPYADDALRSKVFEIVDAPASPSRRLGDARRPLRGRRLLLVLVPTATAAATISGLATQMLATRSPSAGQATEAVKQHTVAGDSAKSGAASRSATTAPLTMEGAVGPGRASDPVAGAQITIKLKVPRGTGLSEASRQAVRTTRELGGRVISRTGTSRGAGVARLTLGFPAGRVEHAIARLTRHGMIVSRDGHADQGQAPTRVATVTLTLSTP